MVWETNGINKSPVFDLIGAADFSVTIENAHAGIAGDGNIIGVSREDYCHAVADIVSIEADCCLTHVDAWGILSRRNGWYNMKSPWTSRIEFLRPWGSCPGEYPRSRIVMRAIFKVRTKMFGGIEWN